MYFCCVSAIYTPFQKVGNVHPHLKQDLEVHSLFRKFVVEAEVVNKYRNLLHHTF